MLSGGRDPYISLQALAHISWVGSLLYTISPTGGVISVDDLSVDGMSVDDLSVH